MSRIGKKPVPVPAGVTATVEGQKVSVKGPKGELFFVANDEISVKLEDNAVVVQPINDSKDARSKWGMSRTMVENILKGVKDGYERKLEINGVGYRASLQGKTNFFEKRVSEYQKAGVINKDTDSQKISFDADF